MIDAEVSCEMVGCAYGIWYKSLHGTFRSKLCPVVGESRGRLKGKRNESDGSLKFSDRLSL